VPHLDFLPEGKHRETRVAYAPAHGGFQEARINRPARTDGDRPNRWRPTTALNASGTVEMEQPINAILPLTPTTARRGTYWVDANGKVVGCRSKAQMDRTASIFPTSESSSPTHVSIRTAALQRIDRDNRPSRNTSSARMKYDSRDASSPCFEKPVPCLRGTEYQLGSAISSASASAD